MSCCSVYDAGDYAWDATTAYSFARPSLQIVRGIRIADIETVKLHQHAHIFFDSPDFTFVFIAVAVDIGECEYPLSKRSYRGTPRVGAVAHSW